MLTLLGFLGGTEVKNPLANSGDPGDLSWIPGPGSYPGEGNDNPFQYSCLGNPGAWDPGTKDIKWD